MDKKKDEGMGKLVDKGNEEWTDVKKDRWINRRTGRQMDGLGDKWIE